MYFVVRIYSYVRSQHKLLKIIITKMVSFNHLGFKLLIHPEAGTNKNSIIE